MGTCYVCSSVFKTGPSDIPPFVCSECDRAEPWEEDWIASDDAIERYAVKGRAIGDDLVFSTHKTERPLGAKSGCSRRARLAAAAPDLYRALAAVEWKGTNYGTTCGEVDYSVDCCPACGGLPKEPDGFVESPHVGHHGDCVLNAALKKARGES